jgi:hypothetical protein
MSAQIKQSWALTQGHEPAVIRLDAGWLNDLDLVTLSVCLPEFSDCPSYPSCKVNKADNGAGYTCDCDDWVSPPRVERSS